MTTKIRVKYRSVDHFTKARTFKTLKGAQKFAQAYVGETPELGSCYAVSGDGVGTVYVAGCSMYDLFPKCAPADEPGHFEETYEEQQRDPSELHSYVGGHDCECTACLADHEREGD